MNSPVDAMDDRVTAAIIAAAVSAVVAVLSWVFAFFRDERRERRRRRERVIDVQKAIRAEIETHVYQLERDDLDRVAEVVATLFGSDPGYVPFIPRERHDVIFAVLVGDIQVLPTDTIRPVVVYYDILATIDAMTEDMRSERYGALDPERRALFFADYMDTKRNLLRRGQKAIESLSESIALLEQGASPINRPVADQSGR
ncbi:hypothetical protein [Pontivivens ytuae]|uniref:DUF2489 domain-containing protein n=1 Tax=Pontivivens ytuae TaxID=2789856 RepID=A0A7S9LUT3_9RHOB|nr:hypothetical protein [Pontivivens ytuae]QPH55140.1 hypothetical protein I0K15_05170 [Pontivivens ytuae]